jgi:hypothetical protein
MGRYGLAVPGYESRWGRELVRTRPDRSWYAPRLLFAGYRTFFLGVKRSERGVIQPSSACAFTACLFLSEKI